MKRHLAELVKTRDDPTVPAHEREAACAELEELGDAYARGGKIPGGAASAAERVRKAIRPMIDYLKEAEISRGRPNLVLRAFGEHLEQYLWRPSVGGPGRAGAGGRPGCYTYERPAGVVWRD